MDRCLSTKNKQTDERCPLKSLIGMHFCGRHAKMKKKRLWVHKKTSLIRFQSLWRGYNIRRILKLGGKGCLNRKDSNDYDEIVTFASRTNQNPLEYFEFYENGVNFWFDIKSIYQWSCNDSIPRNPYTKNELSIDTRRRMRELINIRKLKKLPIMVTIQFKDQTVESRANQLSQILEETLHGSDFWYGSVAPEEFLRMSIFEIDIFLHMIFQDLAKWAYLRRKSLIRARICFLVHDLLTGLYTSQENHTMRTLRCLIYMLTRIKKVYPLCYIIWSALHRM